jgi:hypothetical protein
MLSCLHSQALLLKQCQLHVTAVSSALFAEGKLDTSRMLWEIVLGGI